MPRYVKVSDAYLLDKVYAELVVEQKVHPIIKIWTTAYLRGGKGKGLLTATWRLMWGGEDVLIAALTKAGLKVRDSGSSEWSAWVTFDVPTSFLRSHYEHSL